MTLLCGASGVAKPSNLYVSVFLLYFSQLIRDRAASSDIITLELVQWVSPCTILE